MFNEGEVISSVLEDVLATFEHVVAIDDGSSDDSAERAHLAGAWVVRHPVNLGQGASLQTGFDFALSDPLMTEVVTFDADGQHSVADAKQMVERLQTENLDVIIGSRFIDNKTEVSRLKRLILWLATRYMRFTSGLALTDAHNGLRVIQRRLLEQIELRQNRMAHASELIDLIGQSAVKWAEHPTHILYTDYSKAKGQSILNSINILVELLFK
ncbi:MAG: glycosyltransferase family 2 protein [Cryobacterium sp.]|nr:glycosyltransferase family 2 protein [Cryobacterium sp.]